MPAQIYVNRSCSKCRTAQSLLDERQGQADVVRSLDEPPLAVIARPPERVL